ncbi:MAG: amino acid ABC transporter permease [Solirubrobacterales bacterium]
MLADALGPKAKRRVLIISIVTGIGLLGMLAIAVQRLADKDQLEWEKWKPFTEWKPIQFLLGGLGNTLKAAAVAMVLAIVVGAGLALARLSRTAPVRWLALVYMEFFRGVPLILLILFTFFALPKYGIDMTQYRALVLALTLYNSAMLGEVFRAGILSLDRGQTEAANAIGLTYWQGMGLVIIPQAARRMIPAIVSQLITLLKDTSLGYVISYEELLRRGRISGEFFKNPLQAYFFVALLYIAVNFTLSRAARRLEIRQRRRLGAGRIAIAGVEDLAVIGMAADAATN